MEAWDECQPEGYIADERWAGRALLALAQRRLEAARGAAEAADVQALLAPAGPGGQTVLQRLLRAHAGKVHFLYFWKAVREVSRVAAPDQSEGPTSELETLRDEVLRILEDSVRGAHGQDGSRTGLAAAELPTDTLVQEILRAASMSAEPQFWQDAAVTIREHHRFGSLTLQEVTGLHLCWLRHILMWESLRGCFPDVSLAPEPTIPEAVRGLPVVIHVYDVSQQDTIKHVNKMLAHEYAPLKLGGIFHAGVEVNGLEWSFGFTPSSTRSGVFCCMPKQNAQHHYRESVRCRYTSLSAEQINSVITELVEEWRGRDYDLLRRNCCHFADEFCRRLKVGGIPGWVHRLARIGARLDNMLNGSRRDALPVVAAGAPQSR